jgi:hypothetical protein
MAKQWKSLDGGKNKPKKEEKLKEGLELYWHC